MYNPRPAYQDAAVSAYLQSAAGGRAAPGYNPQGRGYPDLSFVGVDYFTYIGGKAYLLAGTSASAPVAAAMSKLL